MIENVRRFPKAAIIVISVYYLVGIIGLTQDITFNLFKALVPFTLLCSLYFLWLFHEKNMARDYLYFLLIFILGFIIEAIGVNTGLIFGPYEYGRTLGFKLFETPLLIGVNWLLLTYSVLVLTGSFLKNKWLKYLVSAIFMVLYDIVLEPVAIRLDMWQWEGEVVPIQNYIAWFAISFIFLMILDLTIKQIRNKIATALFIVQFLFFAALNIIYKFI